MGIATNEREVRRQATEDEVKKRKIERTLVLDMRRFFRQIAQDFVATYALTGSIINVNVFRDELTAILRSAYRKSKRAFQDNIRESLDQAVEDEINLAIEKEMADYIREHSVAQSGIIMNTTQQKLNQDVEEVTFNALQQGETLTNAQIAQLSSREFVSESIGRSNTIATTETQNSSERMKNIEAVALLGAKVIATDVTKKKWATQGDEKVRASHVLADGQTVNIDDPYIVQFQRLMYPGDASLGASIDNIINCRCSSIIVIV